MSTGDANAGALAGPEQPSIIRAGFGDLPALRELASAAYLNARADVPAPDLAYMEAITYQRLAAAHGGNADQRTLLFLLADFARVWRENGNIDLATRFDAEALMLAERLAEEGDEEVGQMVVAAAPALPSAAFREALNLQSGPSGHRPYPRCQNVGGSS